MRTLIFLAILLGVTGTASALSPGIWEEGPSRAVETAWTLKTKIQAFCISHAAIEFNPASGDFEEQLTRATNACLKAVQSTIDQINKHYTCTRN